MRLFSSNAIILFTTVLLYGTDSALAGFPDAIHTQFRQIDSTLASLILEVEAAGNNLRRIDSLCSGVISADSNFNAFLIVDGNGKITADIHRDGAVSPRTDVSGKRWYSEAFDKKKEYHDVTRIGSKNYLIKSRLLYNKPASQYDSSAVFAVLIDLEYVFMKLQQHFESPAVLLMNGRPVYESNWIRDNSIVVDVRGYNGLSFAVAKPARLETEGTDVNQKNGFGKVSLLWVVLCSILVVTILVIAVIVNRIMVNRLKNGAFVELAHRKLSPEERERIHKMAVSHVYCEIKRSVETHEINDIEKRVRNEVENVVRKKVTG